jgi:hypothetical protein
VERGFKNDGLEWGVWGAKTPSFNSSFAINGKMFKLMWIIYFISNKRGFGEEGDSEPYGR